MSKRVELPNDAVGYTDIKLPHSFCHNCARDCKYKEGPLRNSIIWCPEYEPNQENQESQTEKLFGIPPIGEAEVFDEKGNLKTKSVFSGRSLITFEEVDR